jgi:hypothetical protein
LVVGGTDHAVLDRATGATRLSWFGTVESRAALVPGGVVTSDVSTLSLSRDGDGTVWEKAGGTEQYTLVAVRDEVVVAAVKLADGYTLTGFALADGTQVWTMSNLVRVGFVKQGTEPARPPGALRTTRLIPVVRANAPGWSLVDAGSGAVVATTPAGVVPVSWPCPRLRNPAPTWRCSARTSRSPGRHRPAATARRCGRSTGAGFW